MAEQTFHLRVGEEATLGKGLPVWVGLRRGVVSLIYGGMPNESVYSLIVTYASGWNSLAYNLYFPATQTTIELKEGFLDRLEASPDSIYFRYVKGRQ